MTKNSTQLAFALLGAVFSGAAPLPLEGYLNGIGVYRLSLLLSHRLPAERVRDISEDYGEYLSMKKPTDSAEGPLEFCRNTMEEEPSPRLQKSSVAGCCIAAILLLLALTLRNGMADRIELIRLTLLSAVTPLALWLALGGAGAAPFDTMDRRQGFRLALLSALGTLLLAGLMLLALHLLKTRMMSEWEPDRDGVAFHVVLLGCQLLFILLALLSAYMIFRRSLWYFCTLSQSLAGWSFFRGIALFLGAFSFDGPVRFYEVYLPILPCVLGLLVSLAFALYLRRNAGKGAV